MQLQAQLHFLDHRGDQEFVHVLRLDMGHSQSRPRPRPQQSAYPPPNIYQQVRPNGIVYHIGAQFW